MATKPEKTVRIAELKARLSAYLKAARRGHPVTIYDRDTPVARIVPYESEGAIIVSRHPLHSLQEVSFPRKTGRPIDSLTALLEERQSSR